MTKRALLVGAASSLAASAIAASLRDNGEATLIDGELIDPERVILGQTGGQIAEIFVKSPIPTTDSDGLPNRLSIDRNSPHYTNCGAFVGVKIDGEEASNCIEFCVSEGWVRLGSGGAVTRAEVKHAERKYGKVEVYWRSPPSRQVRRQMARMAR